jgi:hypothetical protein
VFDPLFYNKVYFTADINNILFTATADQKVYVSHINGKLQVRFCPLAMPGYSGDRYTTYSFGNIVEL